MSTKRKPAPLGQKQIDDLLKALKPGTDAFKRFQARFRAATPWMEPVGKLIDKAMLADDKLPSSRVAQGAGLLTTRALQAGNVDPRVALAVTPLLLGRVSAGGSDDVVRAARAGAARRLEGKPGNASQRNVRLQGGRVQRVDPDVKPTRVAPSTGDPLARTRSTTQEAYRPLPPLGKPGGVRNLQNQVSTTGSPTVARVSSGGYKPSGRADNKRQGYRFSNETIKDETDGPFYIQGVEDFGKDPKDYIPSDSVRLQPNRTGSRNIFSGPGLGKPNVGGQERPPMSSQSTSREIRAANRAAGRVNAPNSPTNPNWNQHVPQESVGAELVRQRRALARAGSGTRGVTIEPSYENGSRIIYGGGSANVSRQNPYDPDASRARYRGTDQSPSTQQRAAMHEGGDDSFQPDDFVDYSRETGYNPGFSETKRKGERGVAGAANRSVSREVRQRIIDEFRLTEDGGAVYGTTKKRLPDGSRKNVKTLLQAGTKTPSDDYINSRLQRALGEHRAATDAATGRRTTDSIKPGNRFKGNADRLSEPLKKDAAPHITTYGGSMPQGPIKRGNGPTVKGNQGLRPAFEAAARESRAAARGQSGPTTYMYDKPTGNHISQDYVDDLLERRKATDRGTPERKVIDKELKAIRERTLSKALQNARENTRPGTPERARADEMMQTYKDPQLTRDTDVRNREARATKRATPVNVQHVLSQPYSGPGAAKRAAADAEKYGLRVIKTSDSPRVFRLVQADALATGRNNTRVEGRTSRPVREVINPPEPKERTRVTRDGNNERTYEEQGYWGVDANGNRKFFERSQELTQNRNYADPRTRGRVTPADPSIQGHNASKPAAAYAERQRERRRAERQGRPAERELTKAEAKDAMKQLAIENRTRSGPIDQGLQENIRRFNERLRLDGTTRRLLEFSGVKLEPEIIRNPAPEFPNIAKPTSTDGRWAPETYGDLTPRRFTDGGELRGTKTKGKSTDKGRSSDATRVAEVTVQRSRQRHEEGKPQTVQRTYKRGGTRRDGTTYQKGDPKEVGKTQAAIDAQMEAIRKRRAEARKSR